MPDPSLFGQLVQEVSGSLVTAANSASGLTTFMLAKRREGVLSHFPPHVGAHFKKDLASSSNGGPHVFDDKVLARIIATSMEDSNLDAQLSIAKAFTLPVFRADVKKPGRKASSGQERGGCWTIIDLSTLNLNVDRTLFRMETSQTVLRSVWRNDWMVSIDVKDAYLQITIHPASRRYLGFTAGGRTWQFRVLCFGLSPQVFTRVMAPVSGFLHQLGVRMLRYLDDWLILGSSRQEACWARDQVLSLCQELGIVVNLEKSTLTPSQQITYLGIRINSQTFRASATPSRIEKFSSIVEEFVLKGAVCEVLGHLASLSRLVPNGQLRMRALQLALSRGWDFWDEEVLGPWDPPSRDDLRWCCTEGRLDEGISLALRSPDQMFWSDASNHGWGATVADHFASGVWLEGEASLSINHHELLAVERGFRALCTYLEGRGVTVFSDNMTAVAYLRRQGGTLSQALNAVAQCILHWAEQLNIVLMPQFVPGRNNMVADALSRPNQVIGSEWVLHQEVFNWLRERWPVTIDLFASSISHRCSVYFAPMSDPMAAGTDAMLQSWDLLQAYAFPPFAMIGQVLAKVRASQSLELTLVAPFWPQRPWFPELLELLILPPLPLPSRWDLLRQPHVRRFHQNLSMLCLHAWSLSRDLREPPASLVAWLDNLGRRGGSLR